MAMAFSQVLCDRLWCQLDADQLDLDVLLAAFVADIYGAAQVQGPALTSQQSSQLSGMYSRTPQLLVSRVGAAVAQVNSCAVQVDSSNPGLCL